MTTAPLAAPDTSTEIALDLYRDAGITVQKLGEHIGAKVSGLRLGGDLTDAQALAVRHALAANKVIVFSDQRHLDDDGQYAFAQRIGDPTGPHPTVTSRGTQLLTIEGAANSWHVDVSFVDRIPKASILRAVTLPSWGGATTWASTVAAYNDLPAPLKALVDNLWATHTNAYDYASSARANTDEKSIHSGDDYYREFTSTHYETLHPVVRVHPETGERSLLLGHFVKDFPGFKTPEFAALFQLLQNRITRLENTFRWNWSLGDVAIWDNRATQHYGIADFGNQDRKLNRITLAGDVPVSTTGEHSRIITGDASHYSSIDQPVRLPGYAD